MKEIYSTFILNASIMLEQLDNLQGTPLYRQKLKNAINSTIKALENEIEEPLAKMLEVNPSIVQTAEISLETLIKTISEMDIVDVIVMVQLFEKYKKDKEGFIDRNGIEIIDVS